jgi:hypothetical protein
MTTECVAGKTLQCTEPKSTRLDLCTPTTEPLEPTPHPADDLPHHHPRLPRENQDGRGFDVGQPALNLIDDFVKVRVRCEGQRSSWCRPENKAGIGMIEQHVARGCRVEEDEVMAIEVDDSHTKGDRSAKICSRSGFADVDVATTGTRRHSICRTHRVTDRHQTLHASGDVFDVACRCVELWHPRDPSTGSCGRDDDHSCQCFRERGDDLADVQHSIEGE